MKFIKLIDSQAKGSVPYKSFHFFLKDYLDTYSLPILLHSSYIGNKVNKEFSGVWKDYLIYKNLSLKQSLKREEFIQIFKEEFFNDESAQIQYFEFLKETTGKFAKLLLIQTFVDFITQNSKTNVGVIKGRKTDLDTNQKLNNYDVEQQMLAFFRNIEKKTTAGTFFRHFEVKNINQYGFINSEHVNIVLSDKYKLEENFINNFCQFFKTNIYTLVDLLKIHEFIQNNCEKSHTSSGEIISFIEDSISNLKSKDLLLLLDKYNLKSSQVFSLQDTCNYFNVLFNIEIYDSFTLFKDLISLEDNPLHEDLKFTVDYFLSHYHLYDKFDPIKENAVVPSKMDPFLKQTLDKLFNFLISQTDSLSLFNKLDTDKSGSLSREEFLNFLNSIKLDINDSQKLLVLEYADKNHDDQIDYIEFLELAMKNPKIDTPKQITKLSKESKETKETKEKSGKSSPSKKPNKIRDRLKLNYNLLKENYDYNLKIVNPKNTFENNNFALQEDLYLRFYDDNNMITELESFAKESSLPAYVIPQDEFFSYLNKKNIKSGNDFDNKILLLSFVNMPAKEKELLNKCNMINYKYFLQILINFRKEKRKKNENGDKFTEDKKKRKDIIMEPDKDNEASTTSIMQVERSLERRDTKKNLNKVFSKQLSKQHSITKEQRPSISKSQTFSNLTKKIDKLKYENFKYDIVETDYFKRNDGTTVDTILNNELAAIKKCEELFNQMGDDETFFDVDFTDNKYLYTNETNGVNVIKPSSVEWYTLKKISPIDKPVFLQNLATADDVIKGSLKDNWFLSALQVLANKDHLLRGEFRMEIFNDRFFDKKEVLMMSTGIYPPIFHYFAKKNIYCFKFYKEYRWRYVITDDRLPCIKSNTTPKLIYGRCKKRNEFWVSLIEKAYAKLHGSYEALNYGIYLYI